MDRVLVVRSSSGHKFSLELILSITIFLFLLVATSSSHHVSSSQSIQNSSVSTSLSLKFEMRNKSFSPAYKERLDYARRLAKCYGLDETNNKTGLPRVDENSQLITSAKCTSKPCFDCIEKVRMCQDRKNCSKEKYETNEISQVDDSPFPVFHCYQESGQQEGVFDAVFRWEYATPSTLDRISKKDSSSIPRIFVVDKAVDGVWDDKSIIVTEKWIFGFDNISENHTYSIRITPVTPTHVLSTRTLPQMRFYGKKERTAGKVTNVSVKYDSKTVATSQTQLLIRWKSGSGSNTSCHYNIYYFEDHSEDYETKESKKPLTGFWISFPTHLNYGKNYTVHIIEKFGGTESHQKEVTYFQVPTCLALHRSFTHCPPPKPINLTVASDSSQSGTLLISWAHPPYTNETNKIIRYNLTVHEFVKAKHGPGIPEPVHSLELVYSDYISGNQTFVKVDNRNITFKNNIRVALFAVSDGGSSDPAVNMFDFRLKMPGQDENLLTKIWIPLVVVTFLVFITVLLFWLKNYRGKRQRKKQLHEYFEKLDKESIQIDPIDDKYSSKWEIPSGSIVLGRVIGEGAFGLVRKALLYKNGTVLKVAVKTLRDGVDETDSGKFWEEFNILKGLEPHKHVVGLVGIVKTHVPVLVVEYCHGGDLQTHLRKASQTRTRYNGRRYSHSTATTKSDNSSTLSSTSSNNEVRVRMTMVTNEVYFMNNKNEAEETVTELDLLSYSRQIVCGMEFLSSNKIVHRDLAARNVLIGHGRILKIADFGLSRDVYEQNWYKKNSDGKIPIKWLALECLLQEVYTTKSDVWSYGILLWEIVTFGGNPYPGVENTRIFDLLKSGYRMPQPENCSDELYHLMTECWRNDPEDRPSFAAIRHKLDSIIEKSNFIVYMNLQHPPTESSESSSLISGEQD